MQMHIAGVPAGKEMLFTKAERAALRRAEAILLKARALLEETFGEDEAYAMDEELVDAHMHLRVFHEEERWVTPNLRDVGDKGD